MNSEQIKDLPVGQQHLKKILKSWGNAVVREKLHNMRLYANDFHKRHFLLPLTTTTSLINVANYVCFAYVYTRTTIIKGNKSPIMFL